MAKDQGEKQAGGPAEQGAKQAGGRFQRGRSGNPAGRPRRDSSALRDDGWKSLLSGLGTLARDKREATFFEPDLIDWETALNIYRGDPLAARIIESKPNDLVREGYELCITDEAGEDEEEAETDKVGILKPGKVEREVLEHRKVFGGRKTDGLDKVGKDLQEEIENRWEELDLLGTLHEALCYEQAYGGAAILIGANDGTTDLSKPLNVKAIRSVDFLTALEPREITPMAWYGNPQAPKFGRPAIYQLTPSVPGVTVDKQIRAMTVQIHESRLIVFPGIRVTRRNLSTLGGWGDSILTRVYRVLRDFNVSWGAAGILVADFAQAVYKMKGLNELLEEDGKDLFKQRMMGMELSRSVARAVMIDADDEFKREATPVTGLPDLLDRFAVALAAAADLPLPLLMGESPGGLNATGASGDQLRMYYDRIASLAKRKVIPAIRRITSYLFQAAGGAPETWTIKARPLWQLTEKEQAETRRIQMEIDAGYLDRSVVTSDEVRSSRFGGDAFSYETSIKDDKAPAFSAEEAAAYIAEQNAAGEAAGAAPLGGEGTSELAEIGPKPIDPAEAPKVEGQIAPAGAGREIQKEALNGAQISSMLEVIKAVGLSEISRESGAAVLRLAFQLPEGDATALLGPETFKPDKPAPPPAFGSPIGKPAAVEDKPAAVEDK